MAGFDPSEPRVSSGSAAGGQWGGSADDQKKASRSAAAKKAAATRAAKKGPAKATDKPAAGGSKPGPPRDANAAKAQADPQAQAMYARLVGMTPAKREYVKGLSDADLEKLTAIVYSSRTSDPNIVHARIAVANEMSHRHIPIAKYGAGGGGLPAGKKAALVAQVKKKGPAISAREAFLEATLRH